MNQKTAIITGVTSGIGKAILHAYHMRGYRCLGIGRSKEKCDALKNELLEGSNLPANDTSSITLMICDLSSQKSIRAIIPSIDQWLGENPLDVLVNNAGTVMDWYFATEDGVETQFAVNHLAPFLLTNLLLQKLKSSTSAKIITVSSGSHYNTRIRWHDIMYRGHYSCLGAYKQSKLCNVLFTAELNKRLQHTTVCAYALDPGLVNTDIGEKRTAGLVKWFWSFRKKYGTSPEEPAKTALFLAESDPDLIHKGFYWYQQKPKLPDKSAYDDKLCLRLWKLSQSITNIT